MVPRKNLRPLPDRLLTVSEVANWLRLSPNTVRKLANTGVLKAYRVSERGDRRFSLAAVSEYLTGVPASDAPDHVPERLLNLGEAALRLGIHPATLRKWAELGRLDAYRIGSLGERRFSEHQIEALLSHQDLRRTPPSKHLSDPENK